MIGERKSPEEFSFASYSDGGATLPVQMASKIRFGRPFAANGHF